MAGAGEDTEPIKIVLLGNSGVGKSNLIARFHSNEFSSDFMSTIGVEFMTKKMDVDGVSVKLQIWDTAGQERYASMMKTYYRKAKGALLVYDVTDAKSFASLETWRKNLLAHADKCCVATVTGNKIDMEAVVSEDEAREYATSGDMGFMVTSAKTGDNVEDAFKELTRRILKAADGSNERTGASMKLDTPGDDKGGSSMDCC